MSVGGGAAGGGLLAGNVKIAVAALVVVGGGGAAYVATGGDVPFLGGSNGMIDKVPEDVDFVMYMDPSIADDEATNNLIDELSSISDSSSSDTGDMKENFEDETDLSYDDLNSVVVFRKYPDESSGFGAGAVSQVAGSGYGAMLIDSKWAEDDFVDAMEELPGGDAQTSFEDDEYEGYTVYVQQVEEDDVPDYQQDPENPLWIGVIADGKYVVGTEDAVKDALDVDAGDEDSFSGDLRKAYDKTRDGMIKFASTMPESRVPSSGMAGAASQAAENVNVVSGSYYSSGSETVGVQMRMMTDSSSDAEDITKQIDGGLAQAEESVDDDDVVALLNSVETSQEGATAVVTFEADVGTIADGVEALSGLMMGGFGASGSYSSSVASPTASYGAAEAQRATPA